MEKVMKNKKIIYAVLAVIIIIGILVTCVLKLNFSLMNSNHTKINVYIGKNYDIKDIKAIAEEVLATKQIAYQEIEKFNEAISITVKEASEEQIENLKQKIKEKYELETVEGLVQVNKIGNQRGRDIVKPYIIPMVIVTILMLAYVGIRYTNLGVYRTIFTLLLRLVVAEAVYLSIIAIARIPISVYVMPIAIGIYILVMLLTVAQYQRENEKMNIEEKKKI